MAGLNIAEKRLPQDGRIRLRIAGRDIDVRVSTLPTTHGERIVLRLLDRSQVITEIDQLGFNPELLRAWRSLIRRPYGILLVTGPTGSGKTTTLYASLNEINKPDLNIITIEDPVEYQLRGIGQIPVNPKIGLTFAHGLRTILRQDPDVILVGEIRDLETAEIAIQASLTGHLVFSTLHTNDAPSAITRLTDMGIEPYLVASSLLGVLAQRLVRTLCPYCKVPVSVSPEALRELTTYLPREPITIYEKKGCTHCKGTGYRGRAAIGELLRVTDLLRQTIVQTQDANSIRKIATEQGMKTLREDGALKVFSGVTTVEEVLRVTQEELPEELN
jgi:general secretion pathway protein E